MVSKGNYNLNNHKIRTKASLSILGQDELRLKKGVIRPIRSGDMVLIADLLTRLSTQTVWYRFLSPLPGMDLERAWKEVNRLWNNPDSLEIALILTVKENGAEQAIAIAELVHTGEQPNSLELGIVVRDDYQKQGIGTAMLRRLLMYAESGNFSKLLLYISNENLAMRKLVQKLGRPYSNRHWPDFTLVTLQIKVTELGQEVA